MTTAPESPFLPFLDRVVIATDPTIERRGVGGLILPAPHLPTRGTVVAVGPGRYAENGTRIPMALQPGDRVEFPPVGGTDVECDGEQYHMIPEPLVLAVVHEPF